MKNWISYLRGIAIIAVVICHQQGILHTSEYIQMLTLYSVTTFVFLMGYTNALSQKKHRNIISSSGCLRYNLNKIKPVLCTYFMATVVYSVKDGAFTGTQFEELFSRLFSFSVAPPLYFVRYYIIFTLLSPVLFYFVARISDKRFDLYSVYLAGYCLICYVIGYVTIGKADFLGGSYLAIYSLGLASGYNEFRIKRRKSVLILGLFLTAYGLYSTERFYMNRVAGVNTLTGLDKLVPKLQMNPPNLSICIYSMGIIIAGRIIFEYLDELTKSRKWSILKIPLEILKMLGQYSLDIFIWHMLIQYILTDRIRFSNIYLKRTVYYTAMMMLPILFRRIYIYLKSDYYRICTPLGSTDEKKST